MTKESFYISLNDPPAKRRILEEGLRLFAERGLSATSIRDIAAETGYSNPALYKHFKTKEALAVVLFESSYRELSKRVALAMNRSEGFSPKFTAYIYAFTEFYDEHPAAAVFISDNLAALWPQVSRQTREQTIITLTRKLLIQGRHEGFVSENGNLTLLLVLVAGTLTQMIRQLFLGEMKGPAKSYAHDIEKILRKGLA